MESGDSFAYLAARTLDAIARLRAAPTQPVLALLGRDDWAVYKRLRLHFLSRSVGIGDIHPQVLEAIADPAQSVHYFPYPEYDSLLQAAFESGSEKDRTAVLVALDAAARDGGEQAELWLYGRLAIISGDLSSEWTSRFLAFGERFGAPPERSSRSSSKSDSPETRSPLRANQAETMPAIEIAAFAREWSMTKEDFFFEQPTWRGLSAEIEAQVKRRPREFSKVAESYVGVERTVISALFRGLKDAVQDDSSIDWEPILHLIQAIAAEDETVAKDRDLRFGRDVSWSDAKHRALELLRAGLGSEDLPAGERQSSVWKTIELLAINGDGDMHSPLDDVHDSVFVALNSTRSQAVYTAVAYLLWLRRNGSENVPVEIRKFFSRILDPQVEPFVGVRAAVAHKVPQLAYVNEQWLIRTLPAIFPEETTQSELWSAAWDAYLRHATPMPSPPVLEALERNYARAISLVDDDHEIGGHNDRVVLLGIHLAAMFLLGILELDHPNVVAFFGSASGSVRSRVYGWVGRIAGQEGLTETWYARARQFVEWREQRVVTEGLDRAELRMLGWLVASGRFPVQWWSSRIVDSLRSDAGHGGEYIPHDDMMRQVADVASNHPAMALAVLELVVEQSERHWHQPYLDSGRRILSIAMQHPELGRKSRSVADRLARAGHDDFEEFSTGAA